MLPIEYPKWEQCYYNFRLWSKKKGNYRSKHSANRFKKKGLERTEKPMVDKRKFVMIDAQSVRNTNTAERKRFDAGKKNIRNKKTHSS
jgi:hypothetical protein